MKHIKSFIQINENIKGFELLWNFDTFNHLREREEDGTFIDMNISDLNYLNSKFNKEFELEQYSIGYEHQLLYIKYIFYEKDNYVSWIHIAKDTDDYYYVFIVEDIESEYDYEIDYGTVYKYDQLDSLIDCINYLNDEFDLNLN